MIFLYRCTDCKYEFDSQSPDTPSCPKCQSKTLKVFCPATINMGEDWPQWNDQAGKTFNSRSEEDRHFDKLGANKA